MTVPAKTATPDTKAQLTKLRAQVRALRKQLREARRLATMGTMTAMVAHEFSNILTPIINYAQMARKNPALTAKAIDQAADGGQRATSIADAILGIARGDGHGTETFALAELIDRTVDAMARPPERDHIDLAVDVPRDMTLSTRRIELQQVLLNLLLNARAAVMTRDSARRTIEVSAWRGGGKVRLRVRDNGPGIGPENLQRIFQPFYSTKDPDDEYGGHGLGLAFCHDIVAALGGTISVESSPGQGAAFTVALPD